MRSPDPATTATATVAETSAERIALWGVPLAALIVAMVTIAVVWVTGDTIGLSRDVDRIRASLVIVLVLATVVVAHLMLLSTGAWASAGRAFRRDAKEPSKAPTRSMKRDARLDRLLETLRATHGWRWRRRTRWLLLHGAHARIDELAPGLKQAAVIQTGDITLIHASPDHIDPTRWRAQLRRARGSRSIDCVVHVTHANDIEVDVARNLAAVEHALRWAAPIVTLHLLPVTASSSTCEQAVGVLTPVRVSQPSSRPDAFGQMLKTLEQSTAHAGIRRYDPSQESSWLMQVSHYVGTHLIALTQRWHLLATSTWLRAPIAGVMFAPYTPYVRIQPVPLSDVDISNGPLSHQNADDFNAAISARTARLHPHWQAIATRTRRLSGRRVGVHMPTALAMVTTVVTSFWTIALLVSAFGNHALIGDARSTVQAAMSAAPGSAQAFHTQLALQRQIATLEHRAKDGVPWRLRAGLSRNDELLVRLWHVYHVVALRNLREPTTRALERELVRLSPVRADLAQTRDAQQQAHRALETYLMLANPDRANAAFLRTELAARLLPLVPPGMRAGEWLDAAKQLAGFWADHLKTHIAWRIDASPSLVARTRTALINQLGLASSDDTLYQQILANARGKYADLSLASMLADTDARGLFTTSQTIPGVFSRAAWEGTVEHAIDEASKRDQVAVDWVLSDAGPGGGSASPQPRDDPNDVVARRARLRARYFADYATAWTRMLNSIEWTPSNNLSGVIAQLTRLADPQTSPLIALLHAVRYQAQAGRPSQALGETLVRKAHTLFGQDRDQPGHPLEAAPLDTAFAPLLALLGDMDTPDGRPSRDEPTQRPASFANVSLARVLTADTSARLQLQRIQASPDAQSLAHALAQTVFKGRTSELAQARDEAALTAASLGAQWAVFGDTLFVRPLDTAWQAILQPAAAALNDAWRTGVAVPFEAAFVGRYPFAATDADASFAELGRFMRPDTGLIDRFIADELAGLLVRDGSRWVQDPVAPQALRFEPAFLEMLRLVGPLGTQLYAPGEARYRFDVMPQPATNVTRTELTVDGQRVVYFNQVEAWTRIVWPGNGLNGHASLAWRTLTAGTRQAFDATGDWAFLRLLERAQIRTLDDTRYELVWHGEATADEHVQTGAGAEAGAGTTPVPADPLRFILRTQAADGPLGLLKLRGFRMPQRVFVVSHGGAPPLSSGATSAPPLPSGLHP